MALAVAAFGSALAVVVAVQAPALVPALGIDLVVWATLYLFLRLCPLNRAKRRGLS
ncbi:hypothetical protein [Streptomyces mirabilis]|uniref:hypothetical protein n=1 Tax=Streptomyces mirabilis TaxID=68239 RepID=UPI00368C587E